MQLDARDLALEQFFRAHALLKERLAEAVERASGLTIDAFEVLQAIDRSPDRRLRLSDLAAEVSLSPSGLTRRLDRLVATGMIDRAGCEEDRRGSYASMTARGAEVFEKAAPAAADALRAHFGSKLTEGEARQLSALMKRVAGPQEPSSVAARVELR